jgi:RimJ/RimL family protein N-acetyltransferase
VWAWIQTFRDRVADDFGPQTLDEFVEHSLAEFQRVKTWAIYRDGELGGLVSFERWNPVLGTFHCLFKRELWGHQTTVPALRQVIGEMFDSGISKLALCMFADNRPIIALLRRLGAVPEGHYSRHTMRGGQLVDMVPFALFKEAFYAVEGSSGRDRGSGLDHRRDSGRAGEDHHIDSDAQLDAGNAAAAGPAEAVQLEPADGPVGGDGADSGGQPGSDQPPVRVGP